MMPNVHNHVRGFTCDLYDGDECEDRPPKRREPIFFHGVRIVLDDEIPENEFVVWPIEMESIFTKAGYKTTVLSFKTREKRDDE